MIGRTAPSNPWIFRQIEQYSAHVGTAAPSTSSGQALGCPAEQSSAAVSDKLYDQPTEADRYEMIRTYFRMLIEEELPDATGKMKQFCSWFTHGVPGGAGLRKAIYEERSAPEILSRVEEFFEARLSMTIASEPPALVFTK
jgi:tRNA-dihydrouridine synthase